MASIAWTAPLRQEQARLPSGSGAWSVAQTLGFLGLCSNDASCAPTLVNKIGALAYMSCSSPNGLPRLRVMPLVRLDVPSSLVETPRPLPPQQSLPWSSKTVSGHPRGKE